MKKLIYSFERLRSGKGETIVESIVSLLILSIVLVAVSAMVHTSLNMTSKSIDDAMELQAEMNPVIESDYTASDGDKTILFTYLVGGNSNTAAHEVKVNTSGGIMAFTPMGG